MGGSQGPSHCCCCRCRYWCAWIGLSVGVVLAGCECSGSSSRGRCTRALLMLLRLEIRKEDPAMTELPKRVLGA